MNHCSPLLSERRPQQSENEQESKGEARFIHSHMTTVRWIAKCNRNLRIILTLKWSLHQRGGTGRLCSITCNYWRTLVRLKLLHQPVRQQYRKPGKITLGCNPLYFLIHPCFNGGVSETDHICLIKEICYIWHVFAWRTFSLQSHSRSYEILMYAWLICCNHCPSINDGRVFVW